VILIDVNLLIYAVNTDAPLHRAAKSWWERTLSGSNTVALSWSVLLAFLRLTTRPIFRKPLTVEQAFDLIDSWLEEPSVITVEPTAKHRRILRDLVTSLGTAGNLNSDAHLAALAIEHGAELYSTDSDFARFPQLRWRNPLV